MPLTGSGAVMGAAVLAAIGNPDPAAIPIYATLGDTIALWCVQNIGATSGTMANAGAVVSGAGAFSAGASAGDLGVKLATAMGDPSAAGVATWTSFATALIRQFESLGQVDPSAFVAPTPGPGPLTGTGLVAFTSTVFVPPLAGVLGVADVAAAAMLEIFGTAILLHIQQNALVQPIALLDPFVPFTAPGGGGPITGGGSLL